MATTPVYGLRYQGSTDAPHGPNLGQNLAEDVEDELVRIDAAAAGTAAALAALLTSSAVVSTSQATSSTSYVDLGTSGPAVTKTIGASGRALVIVTCHSSNGTALWTNLMGFAVSGATTVAASDDRALVHQSEVAGGQGRTSAVHLQTGLTPGSNTFTAKYRVTGGTGTFKDRSLIVVAL